MRKFSRKTCKVDGCGKPYFAKGFCRLCYARNRNFGDPLSTGSRKAPRSVAGLNAQGIAELILFAPSGDITHICKIDESDIEHINGYKWVYRKSANNVMNTTVSVMLGRYILRVPSTQKGLAVIHKDGDRFNFKKSNLTQVPLHVAAGYRPKHKKYRGVHKHGDKFVAKIYKKRASAKVGKSYFLGVFDTEDAAAEAYNKKALALNGEFAILNVIEKETT